MRSQKRRRSPSTRAARLMRAIAFVLVTAAVSAGLAGSALAAIPDPADRTTIPSPASAITIRTGAGVYKAEGCTACHDDGTAQLNSNHGMVFRPVTAAGIANMSNNPYFGTFPGGSFTLGQVNWAQGGLAIGQELYIFNGSGSVGGNPYSYPRVGDQEWYMDYPWPGQLNQYGQLDYAANILPGRPAILPVQADPWMAYPGDVNFFTGTTAGTETAGDYGCVRCHSFGPATSVNASGVPSYALEDWGVTCGNCHGRKGSHPAPGIIVSKFGGQVCLNCHQRSPVPASTETSGRPQQIAMEIWDTGQSRTNSNQGYEVTKPTVDSTLVVPGQIETTGGAGHPQSWSAVVTIFGGSVPASGRPCMRCHTTQGYLAHAANGTDVPYAWSVPTSVGDIDFTVTTQTAVGDGCNVCHTNHGAERGLNLFSRRAAIPMETCADCHRNPNMNMLEATSTAAQIPYTDSVVKHPMREMYFGYGGYGVTPTAPAHLTVPLGNGDVGVTCQTCHMPVSVGAPQADSSHLFRPVMPATTLGGVTVGWNLFPAGATTTSPVPKAPAVFPDDSCTGVYCHPQSDPTRDWLQTIITTRQTAILDKLAQAEALRAEAAKVASQTVPYMKARTNQRMVLNDGSFGVHNYCYADSLLDWSIATYRSIIGSAPVPGFIPVGRIAGSDRYSTAALISGASFPASTTADVVVATGADFPDALSASALAGSVNGPILLVQPAAIPAAVTAEMTRLGTQRVWIVGGTGAVSASVETQLIGRFGAPNVVRIAGGDRYETSALVARRVALREGGAFRREAFLATGEDYPDALSCGPYAWARKAPVLLTPTGSLPSVIASALGDLAIDEVTLAGGTGAVSNNVASAVAAITGPGSVTRIAGQDRYNTAILMADYATATINVWATRDVVGIASGTGFADALSAGPALGRQGGVIVLTAPSSVPSALAQWLANFRSSIRRAWIAGGSGAVSDQVWADIYRILNPTP
jgi:putative cell wall-binding protein